MRPRLREERNAPEEDAEDRVRDPERRGERRDTVAQKELLAPALPSNLRKKKSRVTRVSILNVGCTQM